MNERQTRAVAAVKAARMVEEHKAAYIARIMAGDPRAIFAALFLAKRQGR